MTCEKTNEHNLPRKSGQKEGVSIQVYLLLKILRGKNPKVMTRLGFEPRRLFTMRMEAVA